MSLSVPVIEIKLSDRILVEVAELTSNQMDQAIMTLDAVVGEVNPKRIPAIALSMLSTKVFAIGSIRSINGTPVTPYRNRAEYTNASEGILASELKLLMDWAMPIYAPAVEEVGKEQGDQTSD